MQAVGLIRCALTLSVSLMATPGLPDSATPFDMLDAALTFSEIGQADGRPDVILAGVEIVKDLAPSGASPWIGAMLDETRILARGDAALLARADAVQATKPDVTIVTMHIHRISGHGVAFALSSRTVLSHVRTPAGWLMDRAMTEDYSAICPLTEARVTDCTAFGLNRAVTFTARVSGPPGFIAIGIHRPQQEQEQ